MRGRADPVDAGHRRAIEIALRALAARDRTEVELRALLARKRQSEAAIEVAVGEAVAAGLVDDASYARRFVEDRRALDRWGSERIERDLLRRGVAPELIEQALGPRGGECELRSARALLAERLPAPPRDDRDRDRAWRLLMRRGYASELAYEAVRAHERAAGADGGRELW